MDFWGRFQEEITSLDEDRSDVDQVVDEAEEHDPAVRVIYQGDGGFVYEELGSESSSEEEQEEEEDEGEGDDDDDPGWIQLPSDFDSDDQAEVERQEHAYLNGELERGDRELRELRAEVRRLRRRTARRRRETAAMAQVVAVAEARVAVEQALAASLPVTDGYGSGCEEVE